MSTEQTTITDTEVERAARAMAIASDWNGWDTAKNCQHTLGGNEPEEEREHFRHLARVALGAVRPALWCLHLIGPDDVHPAPSRAHAELAAKKLNEWFAGQPKDEHTPHFEAVAAPWPHSAESHAAGVADFIMNFLLPGWQVDPERAMRVAVVNRQDLRTALNALIDIRELKAIRSLGGLPIDRLVEEFNAQAQKPGTEEKANG